MKKTISLGIIFAVAGLFLGLFIAPVSSTDKATNLAQEEHLKLQKNYEHLIRFGNILDVIEKVYVDEPNIDEIMDEAIKAVVASLDPHSEYLPPKKYKELMEQTSGSFGGLGIRVQLVEGLVKAVKVLEDTPAMRAGLHDDDMITKIDDTEVFGITLGAAIDLMRGEVGSPIELMVKRKGEAELLKFNLNREIIKLNPVTFEAKGKIGYIALSSFNDLTEVSLKKAIDTLTKEIGSDIKGFILDLRGNGGGLLNQAFYTADLFIAQGEIASTRGRVADLTQRYNAETGDMTNGQPLVVLIDGDTASSSEIVSGALQDYKRATLIGTRSFGKGSVQTIMPLGDNNAALRITTARYYTPSGRSIQAQGIVPDWIVKPIVPEGIKKLQLELESEATLEGHLTNDATGNSDGELDLGSYSYVPRDESFDIQLIYALKFLNDEVKLGENQAELEAQIKIDIEAKWKKDEEEFQAKADKMTEEAEQKADEQAEEASDAENAEKSEDDNADNVVSPKPNADEETTKSTESETK